MWVFGIHPRYLSRLTQAALVNGTNHNPDLNNKQPFPSNPSASNDQQRLVMNTTTKSAIFALTAAAVAGVGMPSAQAGDREWATAGKILTGVVAATVLAKALEPPPAYVHTTTYYAAPTVLVPPLVCAAPAPTTAVVYQQTTPVVVQPTTVIVQPTPAVVYPAPVIVQSAPVYIVRPAPVITYRYSFGWGRGHHHHPRSCW
jgi:hypothetical protein